MLEHIVRSRNVWQVLCFVRTKHGASRLARQLEKDGLATSAIHGDKTQQARLEALQAFKDGKLQVLVATDVAARGLDIDDLPLVVNYELPHVPEDYVHRIGRTGRAGATGEAISLVDPAEEKYLADIERMLKKKIEVGTPEGFDADRAERTPVRERRPSGASASHERRPSAPSAERRSDRPAAAERGRTPAPPRRPDRDAREEAYAKNPDQPLPRANTQDGTPAAALTRGASPARPGFGAKRPIPALLMKRATEPEKV
jgi:ATP-dependent RNA helicase RhlE